MTYDPSVSIISHPALKVQGFFPADLKVQGFFPADLFKPVAEWWRGLNSAWQRAVAVVAVVTGVLAPVGAAAAFYNTMVETVVNTGTVNSLVKDDAGVTKADEVTNIYNQTAPTLLGVIAKGVKDIYPQNTDIEAARAAGDENRAYHLTMARRLQIAAVIKSDFDLNYTIETYLVNLNNVAICATDGCNREALLKNMGKAFCGADRAFKTWLTDFRKQKFRAGFAQEYVALVATIPCATYLYPEAAA